MKSLITTLVAATFFMLTSTAEELAAPPRTIVVSGQGEAAGAPDQAVIRLGASVQTPQAETSHARVSEIMQKALEAIEKVGVSKKAIRTVGLSLQPVYATPERPAPGGYTEQKLVGFRASNILQVTLDDTKVVSKVIDAGIAAGANELQGITFSLKNDLPQRNRALTEAAQSAREKAQTIARALDVELGAVREVTESGVNVMPQNEFYGGARMMMAKAGGGTPVEPGEVRVQANVTVHYDIGTKAARR